MMNLKNRVLDCMEAAMANHECPGLSLLVMKDGQEALYAEAGYADLASARPVRRDSIFRLYSQSKPVTAAAAMLLMERGVIDLMDPVEKYLPGFRNQRVWTKEGLSAVNRPMQVLDLLGMTSGLCYPDADAPGQYAARLFEEQHALILQGGGMDTVTFANRMGELPLAFQPGDQFRYGTSADVLGAVVEVASGKPFADFLREEFFEPLSMSDTGFWVPEEKRERFVTCYKRVPGGLEPFSNLHLAVGEYARMPAFASGGAGLVSTLDDYAAFATMLMNEGSYRGRQILSPATVHYMTKPQLTEHARRTYWDSLTGFSYGKLMRIAERPGQGHYLIAEGEYGWDGWLGSYFANLPGERVTFLLMQNVTDTGTSTVTRKLRNVVLAGLSSGL